MLGSDFECFLTNWQHIIPATDLGLPDKKEKPIALEDKEGLAGYIHRDNVMVEICTLPAETPAGFADNVVRSFIAGKNWVAEHEKGLGLSNHPTFNFDPGDMNTLEAMEMGCDVDFVAEEGMSVQRRRMDAGPMGFSRFSGGHVHISYENPLLPAWLAACMCDMFIGIPHAHLLNSYRARFYGAVSLHRETSYPDGSAGVEYRALDNFWIHDATSRASVALGAYKVQQVLDLGDDDVLQEMYRLYRTLPKQEMVTQWKFDPVALDVAKQANALWELMCEVPK